MTKRHVRALVIAGVAATIGTAAPGLTTVSSAATNAQTPHVTTVVRGLDAPSEVQFSKAGHIYVGSLATGNVVRALGSGGRGRTIFSKVGGSVTGVAPVNKTTTYVLTGEGAPRGWRLFKGNPKTGKFAQVANLLNYEKAHNPDGQHQCGGKHCDSLSNPYSLLRTRHDILIADAGANDIIAFNIATHRLHTFHVFSNINTGKCKGAKNNDSRHPGCDPVPTGLARGPGNTVFVSLLGAEAPGAARIVELNLQTGAEIRRWGHLSSVDGVAVSRVGVIFASELEHGLNQQKPNFAKTGRIVRIDPATGKRTFAQVSTPGALTWFGHRLYASSGLAYALFAQPPQRGKGKVVRVGPQAFHK